LEAELERLADESVQSLLLEGGPTLATAFVRAGLVDKLMLFVAPELSGAGPRYLGDLPEPLALLRMTAEEVGDDLLFTAYLHEP
jgi:diaminohydroxyphosphoribosylaminopyrimidine deaminase/5-amino-6-(5-phosphoribosylamino)uracil reductase